MALMMEGRGIDFWNADSEFMTLSQEVLQKKVKYFEVKGLDMYRIALASVSNLEQLLNGVCIGHYPKQLDYDRRSDLVRIFNVIAKEIYDHEQSPCVVEFGSFVMDMFSSESDLDLSINFRNNVVEVPKSRKVKLLRNMAKKLYYLQRGGHVRGIQAIMTARVPVVKVIDRGTRIECDVSVENRDGIAKSLIIRAVSTIDERFRKLSFLMKAWAKANNINSSKDRTLNSFSLISLVAFHLQTRYPPILPPFSALFKDGNDPASVVKVVQNYLRYGERNTESLAELFVTLLVKLASVEQLWKEKLCASLCEGSWIFKAWNYRSGDMIVEDFMNQSENIARAVQKNGFEMINGCIRSSLRYIEAFSVGHMHGSMLKELLFGRDSMCSIRDSVTINLYENKIILPVLNYSNQMKMIQSAADLESENQSQAQLHHETCQTRKRHITDLQKWKDETHQTKKRQLTDPQRSQDETYQIKETQLRTELQKLRDETHGTKRIQLTSPWKPKGETCEIRELPFTRANQGKGFMERGKKQLVDNSMKPVSSSGWKQNQGQRKWPHFGENWSSQFAPQVPHDVHLPHSSSFHGPVAVPSVYAPPSTSFGRMYNPIPLAPLDHMLSSSVGYSQASAPCGSIQAPTLMPHGGSIQAPTLMPHSGSIQAPTPMPNFGSIQGQHARQQVHTWWR